MTGLNACFAFRGCMGCRAARRARVQRQLHWRDGESSDHKKRKLGAVQACLILSGDARRTYSTRQLVCIGGSGGACWGRNGGAPSSASCRGTLRAVVARTWKPSVLHLVACAGCDVASVAGWAHSCPFCNHVLQCSFLPPAPQTHMAHQHAHQRLRHCAV